MLADRIEIVAQPAPPGVVAGHAVRRIVALVAEEQLAAGAAEEGVVAEAGDDAVGAALTDERVVAAVAEDQVRPEAGGDDVIAVVGIIPAHDRLRGGRGRGADEIGAVAAEDQERAHVEAGPQAVIFRAAVHRAGVAGLENDRVVARVRR